ncbi:M56 family metallopeptidase [Telluribacter sp. SYSU D00476]|uniref:M56 family metallopeptidase n=1 Tax=Telluribacter sp. SYSU D00476 TaxID=2811430 RepID=UPI001FF3E589|nr:M56 family metallopeptidase [Telluribacter sp. SYSU D00476]
MSPFLEYQAKLAVSLAVISLFYQLVLRRHTFFNWNRWYLLFYSALAFCIPAIDLSPTIRQTELLTHPVIQSIPTIQHFSSPEPVAPVSEVAATPLGLDDYVLILFVVGCILMSVRLGVLLYSYIQIKNGSRLVRDEGVKIYHVAKDIVPFSFGNAIFINPELHRENELREVLLHEIVHVKQKHTLDVIWSEVLCILNWYNPFAWMLRHAIRQNLEFIADRRVLEQGVDPKEYQYLLLKVVGVPDFRIANQFNLSSLKQRIKMMNRMKTARIQLIRFLFVLPLLSILLLAFRSDIESLVPPTQAAPTQASASKSQNVNDSTMYIAGILLDGTTGKPIPDFPIAVTVNKEDKGTIVTDKDGFYAMEFEVKEGEEISYMLTNENSPYRDFGTASTLGRIKELRNHNMNIVFLGRRPENRFQNDDYRFSDWYRFSFDPAAINWTATSKEEMKQLMMEHLPRFAAENKLKRDFRREYKRPKEVISKFRNGYFDRKRELVGYESVTEFFLDGEKVSYQAINMAFRNKPAEVAYKDYKNPYGINDKMVYLTFPLFKDTPPPSLVSDRNVEWIDVEKFDLAVLEKEPYMLDGFRQVYGVGSNLMPQKEEIKRVAVLKGALARYYDRSLKKIWWIETRPPAEVQGRPEFANR